MNYRKITSKIQELTPNEAYTFFCLAVHSDYVTLESHIKQEKLLKFINNNSIDKIVDKTLRNHLNKFSKLGLMNVKQSNLEGAKGYFKRNTYHLTSDNYILVDKELSELQIPNKLKGFLLILRTLCINGTSITKYSYEQISELTKIGKNSVGKYINEAVKLGLLEIEGETIKFLNEDIFIKTDISLKQKVKNLYGEAFTDEELEKFNE